MSSFETSVQSDELDTQVLHAVGDLDLATAPLLLARAEELLGATCERFRLDLSAIRFIDSTGVGVLIKIRNLVHERGGSLEIARSSPAVERVLALVGLAHVFSSDGEAGPPPQQED